MPKEINRLIAGEMEKRYPKGIDYIIVGFEKLTGPETTQLRKTLRDGKIQLEVVKNSIAERAFDATGIGAGKKFLEGPCALLTGQVEMPLMCKAVVEQSKKYENRIFIRGGSMGDAAVGSADIVKLASIPPIAVLRAQMAGHFRAPLARTAGAFQGIIRSLACALDGIRIQKERTSPPPGPQAAASGPVPGAAA